jgi:hypothetical protein
MYCERNSHWVPKDATSDHCAAPPTQQAAHPILFRWKSRSCRGRLWPEGSYGHRESHCVSSSTDQHACDPPADQHRSSDDAMIRPMSLWHEALDIRIPVDASRWRPRSLLSPSVDPQLSASQGPSGEGLVRMLLPSVPNSGFSRQLLLVRVITE